MVKGMSYPNDFSGAHNENGSSERQTKPMASSLLDDLGVTEQDVDRLIEERAKTNSESEISDLPSV